MAFCTDTTWDICICNCEDSQSEHVHCGCNDCNGVPVSRATAFRHRKRVEHSSSRATGNLGLREGNRKGPEELLSSEVVQTVDQDQEMFDYSDSSLDTIGSGTPEENESNELNMQADEADPTGTVTEKIIDAILDALQSQLELKLSNIGFDHILAWGKKIFMMAFSEEHEHLWPKNWKDAEVLLHSVGYRDAKKYMICLDESHRCHFGLRQSEDDLCPHCNKKGTIPYYYLGLHPKINLWVSDPVFCKKILAHWFEKDHWLGQENLEGWGFHSKSEIWDGRRFSELQWFWNPEEEWQLPNVTTVVGLSQSKISILLLMALMDRS